MTLKCILQGTVGDLFFIIRSGEVKVTINQADGSEKEAAILGPGKYFGEKALMKEDKRNANIYSKGATHCYTLDRTAFIRYYTLVVCFFTNILVLLEKYPTKME